MNFRLQTLVPVDWTRSQGDLEDDEVQPVELDPPQLVFEKQFQTESFPCKTMIIGCHGAGTNFLFSAFQSKPLIATLLLPEISNKTCCIYHDADQDIVLVQCNYMVTPERSADWTESLFLHFSPEMVYVLDGVVESEYKTGRVEFPCVRSLSTHSKPSTSLSIIPLETPNFVHGMGSTILEYCQIKDIPATLFASFVSNRKIEKETYIGFEMVCKELKITLASKIHYITSEMKHNMFL
jgi:hypothetical protein